MHPEQDRPSARARDPDRPLDAMGMLALVGDTAGARPLASAAQLLQLLPQRSKQVEQRRRRLWQKQWLNSFKKVET